MKEVDSFLAASGYCPTTSTPTHPTITSTTYSVRLSQETTTTHVPTRETTDNTINLHTDIDGSTHSIVDNSGYWLGVDMLDTEDRCLYIWPFLLQEIDCEYTQNMFLTWTKRQLTFVYFSRKHQM